MRAVTPNCGSQQALAPRRVTRGFQVCRDVRYLNQEHRVEPKVISRTELTSRSDSAYANGNPPSRFSSYWLSFPRAVSNHHRHCGFNPNPEWPERRRSRNPGTWVVGRVTVPQGALSALWFAGAPSTISASMGRRRKPKPLASTSPTPIWWSTFVVSLAGGGMLWAAFPPLRWTWLAWLAPLFWLFLIQTNKLVGRRPYLAMWLASSLHWLAMLQGVRLAHPLNSIGWIALSLYLAAYLPCFVALSRIAVHRWRISVLLAAPIVWTGLELLRSRLLEQFQQLTKNPLSNPDY